VSTLADALAFVRKHEGDAYEDDPDDPGGATKYGISLRFLKGLGPVGDLDHDGDIDADDIRGLTWDEASAIYQREFWERNEYGRLPDSVAIKVFDMAVNMGPSQAHKILQRGLRACGWQTKEDGVLGPETRRFANSSNPDSLRIALKCEQAGFYRTLARTMPGAGKFLTGWEHRAYEE
jgi:lysozyme family protein